MFKKSHTISDPVTGKFQRVTVCAKRCGWFSQWQTQREVCPECGSHLVRATAQPIFVFHKTKHWLWGKQEWEQVIGIKEMGALNG